MIHWSFFKVLLWNSTADYLLIGDEVVVEKAGHETFGLGRFFSSLRQRPVSALAFFAFSLVNVQEQQSYPIQVTQIVKDRQPLTQRPHWRQKKNGQSVGPRAARTKQVPAWCSMPS